MFETPQQYIESLPEIAQAWMNEFIDYTAAKYPQVPLVMFRQRPMFKFSDKYTEGYVMFTAASTHFTVHSMEFDLVEAMKEKLPKASFGKGSIKVKFNDEAAKPALYEYVDAVMARHGYAEAK
ncbi:hypothetical protein [Culicoidibacter larvae]|uniref:DUF1801 domain-containing protein n=1 Tax=Culicoidibacter larvae TaxID=2579976 RepID=A0A5R8QHJ4_9FIRM|nr:hypothetical protein [Culicoidibacter larvae]TLG77519.1 hypothetical protein FEZ08_01805 [Culicoidibacter larvae]